MAVKRMADVIRWSGEAGTAQLARALWRPRWLKSISHCLSIPLISLVLVLAAGCSSNKTQTISESYVQSVVNLNNGLVVNVADVTRLTSAANALQQADSLIRQAVKRRDEALKNFAEINADFDATPEQLNSLMTTNQSATTGDIETLIGLITAFQSALTTEELAVLYPERAEFATQTLMLLDEY